VLPIEREQLLNKIDERGIINKDEIDLTIQTFLGLWSDMIYYNAKYWKEFKLHRYYARMIPTTLLAVDMRQTSKIKIDGYQHKICNYIFDIITNRNDWAIDNTSPLLKEFFFECGERAVNYENADHNLVRKHTILDHCPRKWLWQIRAGHKALYPGSHETIERSLKEWKKVYRPSPKEFQLQLQKTTDLEQVPLPIDTGMEPPKNRSLGSTGASLERSRSAGGQLGMLWELYGHNLLEDYLSKDPVKYLESLPQIFQDLFVKCTNEMEKLHNPLKLKECPIGKPSRISGLPIRVCDCPHPYLYRFVVTKGQGGKARICTCWEAHLNYLASILQKLCTNAMRHCMTNADSFLKRPSYLQDIKDIIKNWSFEDRPFYFHSGDLKDCTNRYPHSVSRQAIKNLIRRYNLKEFLIFDNVIDTIMGPCRVIDADESLDELRNHPFTKDQIHDLIKGEGFLTIIGQHLSSPISFPVMGMMAAYANAKCNKERPFFREADLDLRHPQISKLKKLMQQIQEKRTHLMSLQSLKIVLGVKNDGTPNESVDAVAISFGLLIEELQHANIPWQNVCHGLAATPLIKLGMPAELVEKKSPLKLISEESRNDTEYKLSLYRGQIGHLSQHYITALQEKAFSHLRAEDIPKLKKRSKKDTYMVIYLEIPGSMETSNKLRFGSSAQGDKIKAGEDIVFISNPWIWDNRESIPFYKRNRKRNWRDIYTYSVGDDHLNISDSIDKINDFKHCLKTEFNQIFNNKADYTSRHGAILAEKCIEVNQITQEVYQAVVIKMKQLLDPEISTVKWLDKIQSLVTFYREEYRGKFSRKRNSKWLAYNKAVRLLIANHKLLYNQYVKNGINPSLPSHLGGLGLPLFETDNSLTMKHLKILSFFWKYSYDLTYLYLRALRKAQNPTKVVIRKKTKEILKLYQGTNLVEYAKVKEMIYNKISLVTTLSTSIKTEVQTLSQVLNRTKALVDATYNDVLYDLNLYRINDPSKVVVQQIFGKWAHLEILDISTTYTGKYVIKNVIEEFHEQEMDYYTYYVARPAPRKEIFDLDNLSAIYDIPQKLEDKRLIGLSVEGLQFLKLLTGLDLEVIDRGRAEAKIVLQYDFSSFKIQDENEETHVSDFQEFRTSEFLSL
jgi:hypothetical protein